MTTFQKWMENLVEEKGFDLEQIFEVNGKSGVNYIPLGCVIEAIMSAPISEQNGIKNMIVRIDFKNGDVLHYFKHLAQAIAI